MLFGCRSGKPELTVTYFICSIFSARRHLHLATLIYFFYLDLLGFDDFKSESEIVDIFLPANGTVPHY